MHQKLVTVDQAILIAQNLRNVGQKIVLAGGCFDILHLGHIHYLEGAKKQGDVLFVLLESDQTTKKLKGSHRPIHTQKHRANILATVPFVDYIVLLPPLETNEAYKRLVILLKPAIIATTKGDPKRHYKEVSAEEIGATVVDVIHRVPDKSTTHSAQHIKGL